MADPTSPPGTPETLTALFTDMLALPNQIAQQALGQVLPALQAPLTDPTEAAHWAEVAAKLQTMWLEYQGEQVLKAATTPPDPAQWLTKLEGWYRQMPLLQPEAQKQLWEQGTALWQQLLGQVGLAPAVPGTPAAASPAPAPDKRFAAPQWHDQPYFALVSQTYLTLARQIVALADSVEGIEPAKREQLRFATQALVDAFSPDHFPTTNPLVMERAIATRGESLIHGMEHLIGDLRRGQLTHTDPQAFRVGENIAVTPGKVVHEDPLFQLIQYTPTTPNVLATPVVIFPPWINRFYILDLNPKKSFVRWAVEQGISVFMVSWKSADASMAEVVWDDYIAAQLEAIEVVRERLKVPAVHTVGYCVAGTTLAATLAVLARRGKAEQVKSATFLTAQVDFEKAGELKNFVDDQQIAAIEALAPEGYLDGRYMAATFNLLRGNDLIWSYVVKNYLMGEEYQPFDLLHWNGDVTNLPVKWHCAYLKDLYRDNRLVVPDSLSALGTPIDLARITTPCFIQAGREDHIAPPESVWRITRQLAHAPWRFVLAGSGHIAGVVNPPAAGKYQYWTNPEPGASLEDFVAGAEEHKGSWWPHWAEWLREQDGAEVPAKGKRVPGGRGDKVIEDAPGRYVKLR
jgi:polyhydroxyalkanoate synthase